MNKDLSNEWRLTNQKNYLHKKMLFRKPYEQTSEAWNHDHCAFCWTRIDKKTPIAYTDEKGHWICEKCYNDFNEMFEWKVI